MRFAWTARCGSGTLSRELAPRRVPGLPPIVALAAQEAQERVSALDDSGQVWEWNSSQVESPSLAPVRVPGLTDVVAVTSDLDALRADGRVWNFSGGAEAPARLVPGLAGVKALAPSWAVRADGSAWNALLSREDRPKVHRNDEVFAVAHTQTVAKSRASLHIRLSGCSPCARMARSGTTTHGEGWPTNQGVGSPSACAPAQLPVHGLPRTSRV